MSSALASGVALPKSPPVYHSLTTKHSLVPTRQCTWTARRSSLACRASSLEGPQSPLNQRPLNARPLSLASEGLRLSLSPSPRHNALNAASPRHHALSSDNGRSSQAGTRLASLSPVHLAAEAAAAQPAPEEEEGDKMKELGKTIQLGCLFGMWYLFNIYFNIYNKQVLKVFPFPLTITLIQFTVGAVIVQLMWLFGMHERPRLTRSQLLAIVPLAAVHTLGNTFTNMSLGKVAVSFTHTIKAMEPFFSVLLSALVLGDKPSAPVILALLPIVGGVALASATEASFNWGGFLSAMASNLTFQSRNVLSKKLMIKNDASLDNINLFAVITTLSFFLLLPVVLLTEGVKFTPQLLEAKGLNVNQVMFRALMTGVCFHAYQQVSYMILQQVSPVTHSVGNCVKRVIVIVTSVVFFRTPVSALNAVGTGIALAGVFGYSRVKASKAKKA